MAGGTGKHIPLRKCVGCGEMKPKQSLIRVIRPQEGEVRIDPTGRQNGRGAYLCRAESCLRKAFKNKGLERSLKMPVGITLQETLLAQLEEWHD